MTLWTIQPLAVYEKLIAQGTLRCDPEQDGFWGIESPVAYGWLVEQMKLRVGAPPQGTRYPIWAWALIDGVSKKPDLRRSEFKNHVGENVVIELEIPDADVLLSDEENWHFALGNHYMHDLDGDDGKWDEAEAWFDSLPGAEKESVRKKSWERIFDREDKENSWKFVQATFWELRADQIKSVRRFTGRGKN